MVSFSRPLLLAVLLATSAVACVPRASAGGPATAEAGALEPLEVQTAGGARRFRVELADDDAERQRGLMFRESLAADRGMLFDFGSAAPRSFWMKNTLAPLDIIFIGEDGRVQNVGAGIPFSEAPVPSAGSARYVLEINAGLAAKLGVQPGDKVRHRLIPGD